MLVVLSFILPYVKLKHGYPRRRSAYPSPEFVDVVADVLHKKLFAAGDVKPVVSAFFGRKQLSAHRRRRQFTGSFRYGVGELYLLVGRGAVAEKRIEFALKYELGHAFPCADRRQQPELLQ